MSLKKVKIVSDHYLLRKTGIELDGVTIYPESLKLEMGMNQVNVLTLSILVKEIEVEAPILVVETAVKHEG